MFSLKEFVKKGLLDAVGKMADYQVILNAAGWHEKGVLSEGDLAEISAKIDERNSIASADVDVTELAGSETEQTESVTEDTEAEAEELLKVEEELV